MPGTTAKLRNTSETAGCKFASDLSFALDSGLSWSNRAGVAGRRMFDFNSCSHAAAHAVVVRGPDKGWEPL